MYPEIAIIGHAISNTALDTCVTVANRLRIGLLRLPQLNNKLWWPTKAKPMTPIEDHRLNERESFRWIAA